MATSTSTTVVENKLSFQECLRIVKNISRDVSNCEDIFLPSILIGLQSCLESQRVSSEELSIIKTRIWKEDLLHVLIEVIRNDYSQLEQHWKILTNLAITLATGLAGLAPEQHSKQEHNDKAEMEQLEEFYEIVLPTATDSILILTNSILEEAADRLASASQGESEDLLACFKKMADSLVWVCSSHHQCIMRSLQSPYFLHMLITDIVAYSHVTLGILETLMLTDKSSISTISRDVFTSILDELIYKLSGSEEKGATLSFRLLAQIALLCPDLIQILTDSYSGLLELLRKWINPQKELGPMERNLITKLESCTVPQEDSKQVNLHRAAVIIQSHWRGHISRKKMAKLKRGIQTFQLLYRRRKLQREERKKLKETGKLMAALKQRDLMNSQLAFHKKQLSLYEKLPASEINDFMKRQENLAAIKIQSTWRSWSVRSHYKRQKSKALLDRSAVVIQRAVRKHLQGKKEALQPSLNIFPEITGPERERLQSEIDTYRLLHPPTGYKSEKDMCSLHHRVQKMYEDFCHARLTQKAKDDKTKLLLSQLSRNSEFLMSAPSLEDSVTSCEDLVERLSSSSADVGRMARRAHREELKSLTTPWWKRPPLDHEELGL